MTTLNSVHDPRPSVNNSLDLRIYWEDDDARREQLLAKRNKTTPYARAFKSLDAAMPRLECLRDRLALQEVKARQDQEIRDSIASAIFHDMRQPLTVVKERISPARRLYQDIQDFQETSYCAADNGAYIPLDEIDDNDPSEAGQLKRAWAEFTDRIGGSEELLSPSWRHHAKVLAEHFEDQPVYDQDGHIAHWTDRRPVGGPSRSEARALAWKSDLETGEGKAYGHCPREANASDNKSSGLPGFYENNWRTPQIRRTYLGTRVFECVEDLIRETWGKVLGEAAMRYGEDSIEYNQRRRRLEAWSNSLRQGWLDPRSEDAKVLGRYDENGEWFRPGFRVYELDLRLVRGRPEPNQALGEFLKDRPYDQLLGKPLPKNLRRPKKAAEAVVLPEVFEKVMERFNRPECIQQWGFDQEGNFWDSEPPFQLRREMDWYMGFWLAGFDICAYARIKYPVWDSYSQPRTRPTWMGYAPRLVFLDRHGLESRSPNEIVEARLSGTPWHTPKADEQGRRKASFRELQAELKRLGFKHLGNVGPIVTRPDLKKAARDKRPEERTQKDFFDSVMWIEERWVKPVQPEPKPVPRTPETNGAMDREARASLLRYIIKA